MTLEATVVFPVFMVLLFCLINFINLCGRYVAMDHAVSETAKDIATHLYPMQYVSAGLDSSRQAAINKIMESFSPEGIPNPLQQLQRQSQSELLQTLVKNIDVKLSNSVNQKLDPVIESMIKRKIIQLYPLGKLQESDFELVQTELYQPILKNSQQTSQVGNVPLNKEDVALVVEYKVKVLFPFGPMKEITLSNTAVERAWLD